MALMLGNARKGSINKAKDFNFTISFSFGKILVRESKKEKVKKLKKHQSVHKCS